MKGGEELLQRIEAGLQCRPYNVGLQCRPYMTKNIWFVLYNIFVLLYFGWLFYSAEEYSLSKFSMAGGLYSLLPQIKFSFILGSLIILISLIRCFIPLTTNNTNYAKELLKKKEEKYCCIEFEKTIFLDASSIYFCLADYVFVFCSILIKRGKYMEQMNLPNHGKIMA